MITKDLFPNLQWGQLFFDKTKEHIDSYYTLPTSLDHIPNFNILEYKLTPPDYMERDFENFFNFINSNFYSLSITLTKMSKALNQGQGDKARSLLKLIKESIQNLHPFFQHNTNYHVCDLVIHYYILNNIENIKNSDFHNFIRLLCCFVFESEYSDIKDICGKFINLYNKPKELRLIAKSHSFSALREFYMLLSFIDKFPNSKLNYETFQWQQYLLYLSDFTENLHRLPAYSLTNHIKEYYKEFLPYINPLYTTLYSISKETKHVYLSNNEIDTDYRDAKTLYKEYQDTICHMLEVSYKEIPNTYIINSFEDYFFATLLKIIESNQKIVYCPCCLKYHLAPMCELSSDIQQITDLHAKFITRQKAKYSTKYTEIISNKSFYPNLQKDADSLMFLWNQYTDFHYYTYSFFLTLAHNPMNKDSDVPTLYKNTLSSKFLKFHFLCKPTPLSREDRVQLADLLQDYHTYIRYLSLLKTCNAYITETPSDSDTDTSHYYFHHFLYDEPSNPH